LIEARERLADHGSGDTLKRANMSPPAGSEVAETNSSSKVKEEAISPWSPLAEPIFRARSDLRAQD